MSLIHQLPRSTQTLDFSEKTLNVMEDALNTIPQIGQFRNLTRLDLSNNHELIFTQYEQIGDQIRRIPSLKELKISNIYGIDFMHLLHPLSLSRTSLRVFDMSGSFFGRAVMAREGDYQHGMVMLAHFIRSQKELEELRLPDQSIFRFGSKDLLWFSGMLNLPKLTTLSLGMNPLSEESLQKFLADALGNLTNLRHLELNESLICVKSTKIFERYTEAFSRLSRLESLSLKDSKIGQTVGCQLIGSLPKPEVLTSLNLSGLVEHHLRSREMKPVLEKLSSLISLDLSSIDLSQTSQFGVFEMLKSLTTLQELKLNSTKLCGMKVTDVAQACLLMPNLRKLELAHNLFEEDDIEYLSWKILEMTSLESINLDRTDRWMVRKTREVYETVLYNNIRKKSTLLNLLWTSLKSSRAIEDVLSNVRVKIPPSSEVVFMWFFED